MTLNEARDELEIERGFYISDLLYPMNGRPYPEENAYPDEKIIRALEIAADAIEKQMPKQPYDVQTPVVTWGICPACKGLPMLLGRPRRIMQFERYCSNCGQAIDWSDNDDD